MIKIIYSDCEIVDTCGNKLVIIYSDANSLGRVPNGYKYYYSYEDNNTHLYLGNPLCSIGFFINPQFIFVYNFYNISITKDIELAKISSGLLVGQDEIRLEQPSMFS